MRVGTSDLVNLLTGHIQDHPHACGDKHSTYKHSCLFRGSSPCVWGQVDEDKAFEGLFGIIPMRVGTSAKCWN